MNKLSSAFKLALYMFCVLSSVGLAILSAAIAIIPFFVTQAAWYITPLGACAFFVSLMLVSLVVNCEWFADMA